MKSQRCVFTREGHFSEEKSGRVTKLDCSSQPVVSDLFSLWVLLLLLPDVQAASIVPNSVVKNVDQEKSIQI